MATSDNEHLKRLERDFNDGDPINLLPFQQVLSEASNMGFATYDIVEAALICDTKDNLQAITDYLLSDSNEKKKQYDKKKQSMQKEVSIAPEKEKIIDDLKRLLRELQQEKQKQSQLQQELKERKQVTKLELYQEYLRGIIADEIINDKEHQSLDQYKKEHDINDDLHQQALTNLEMSQQDLDDFLNKSDKDDGKKCVVCKNGPKEFVIYDCMHVCLCEKCVESVKANDGPGGGCPVCGGDATKIEKVFAD
jgi:vacuolar-type H+-ATPase subunit I/STV1